MLKTPREVVVCHLTRQSEHLVWTFVSWLILPLCTAVKGLVSVFPRMQPAGMYDTLLSFSLTPPFREATFSPVNN